MLKTTLEKDERGAPIAVTDPRIPFSTFGSYLSVQALTFATLGVEEPGAGVYLCGHVSRGRGKREIARLSLLDETAEPIETVARVEGERLVLNCPDLAGELALCFDGPNTLRVFGTDWLGLDLEAIEHPWVAGSAYPHDEDRWVLNATPNTLRLGLDPLLGRVQANITWQPGGNLRRMRFALLPDAKRLDVAIDYFQSTWKPEPRGTTSEVV